MPQHIRGRIHLLAPWIPPSQMTVFGSTQASPPSNNLPTAQRILRALPTPILRVANSSFMSSTSASISSSLPRNPRKVRRRATARDSAKDKDKEIPVPMRTDISHDARKRDSLFYPNPADRNVPDPFATPLSPQRELFDSTLASKERQADYDLRLTHAIWTLATTNANPAVDLLICLERPHTIGFRYVDITRSVVIHHGSRDSRVPVENVKWLGRMMRRCEVRVLEGEGHGLMASAAVMSNVLSEIGREWEDWDRVVKSGKGDDKTLRERASAAAVREWGI
jgi:hypothetical protein